VKTGAKDQLATLFADAKDPTAAVGILEIFATSESNTELKLAKGAMTHDEPIVRKAAVKTAFAIGGDELLHEILNHLKGAAASPPPSYDLAPEDLHGCEEALLSRRDDAAHVKRVRDAVVAMLPDSSETVRPSLYHILSQLADPASIAALRKACETDSLPELEEIVFALSYSPSRESAKVLLKLAAKSLQDVIEYIEVTRLRGGPTAHMKKEDNYYI